MTCIAMFILGLLGCQSDDQYLYEVNPTHLYPDNGEKHRIKSSEQFIATLYANLFQESISGNQLMEIRDCMNAVGDQELARQMVITRMLNQAGIQIPTNGQMRRDPEAFLIETYRRFYLRDPSQAELTYLVNFIQQRPQLKPDMIYFGFVLGEEFQFY